MLAEQIWKCLVGNWEYWLRRDIGARCRFGIMGKVEFTGFDVTDERGYVKKKSERLKMDSGENQHLRRRSRRGILKDTVNKWIER